MSLRIYIFPIVFFLLLFFPKESAAATASLPQLAIISRDTILIDEAAAEIAYATAKDFYDDMFYHTVQHFVMGIWKLRRHYNHFASIDEDIKLALAFYTAVKDEEKMKALQKMNNKSTVYILLTLFFSLSKLASIYTLILFIGLGGSSIAVALFALPIFLLLENILFGFKKSLKHEK